MTNLTLAISPCPNDVYIFAGLLLDKIDTGGLKFTVDFEDIETLNNMARAGARNVVKISYANYLPVRGEYELLECGGALGRGVGPLLLVNGDRDTFDTTKEILVPGAYTTANFLLDYYLGQPVAKRFLSFDRLYEELCNRPGAQGVVIHEKRFTFAKDGLTLVQDLGEHWEAKTSYAIPLGAVAVRRGVGIKESVDAVIRASLAWSDEHPEEAFDLCRDYAKDLTDGVIQAHIDLYVNRHTRDLGDDGRAAVKFFLETQSGG